MTCKPLGSNTSPVSSSIFSGWARRATSLVGDGGFRVNVIRVLVWFGCFFLFFVFLVIKSGLFKPWGCIHS